MSKSWEQILGGYATDTLTEEEKRLLLKAALQDQTLFDTLADEEALKALLADPEARQRILASLQVSGEPQGGAPSSPSRLSWFRQPSSLAWVGSIAAMGLALIFGWQMDKDWGPIVLQEQEAERSMSKNEEGDKNKEVFRSQTPEAVELKKQPQGSQKKDQREPERVAGLSAPVPSPQSSTMAKASKDSERMRQRSAQVRSEDIFRQEVKKERRLKAKESVPQPPKSAIVQNVPEEEPMDAPSVASPKAAEKDLQELARPPAFADQQQEGDVASSPSARELFYANKSKRVDAVGEALDGMRAQQLLGGLSSKTEKALTEEGVDLRGAREIVQDDSQGQTRGIRYSIVRRTAEGKDEGIDSTKYSGKWSELRLAIESNVSGHLYVLTAYGNEKWQLISPESLNVPRSSDGAINVKAYQPVNFALSQLTNTLGKPVVMTIMVLLSSSSLVDLGPWLGNNVDMSRLQTERIDGAVFVVERNQISGEIIKVEISLENGAGVGNYD